MLKTIYVCRHGFRSNWIDKSIVTGPTKLERDPPLAVYGLEQAEALAKFLSSPSSYPYSPSDPSSYIEPAAKGSRPSSDLPTPELVFSSPFYRCVQTAAPTARELGVEVRLEHGVQEWYSNVIDSTGLHPRPSSAASLQTHFPQTPLCQEYGSTVYASKRGESLSELLARAELFADVFINRIEAEYPDVKTIVIFAHAASVIALGRALTGNKSLHVTAGCATTSLYRRKPTRTSNGGLTTTELPVDSVHPVPKRLIPDGAAHEDQRGPVVEGGGMYECVWNGRADYLVNGVERDWSFKDVVLNADGHVIMDRGDGRPHTPSDELPLGLPKEFTKYLSKPDPYTPIVMRASPAEVQRLAGHENMEEKDDVERAVIGEVSGEVNKGKLERKSSGVALLESRM